jgi:hypothetical protein
MRDLIAKDFHWKAFSILMAMGIWFTVHRISAEPDKQPITATGVKNTYDLGLVAVSDNSDVHNAQLAPRTVNVTVSGPAEIMDKLQPRDLHALVNLTGISSAENLPRDIQISLPRGVTVVDIEPPQVTVTFPKQ